MEFEEELSHSKWCRRLLVMVLRTKSTFARFLASTFHLPRTDATCPTLFPLPAPPGDWFQRMAPGMSSSAKWKVHLSRVLHIVVMALNFWHDGGYINNKALLGRRPTPAHARIFSRLRRFIQSDDGSGSFKVCKSGRRFHQLIARLGELTESTTRLGLSGDPYTRCFQGTVVEKDDSVREELRPYRNLDPERLVLHGNASWDITEYLSDPLVLAFREPDAILMDRVPDPSEFPAVFDDDETLLQLVKIWDVKGLAVVHQDTTILERPYERVRVFNNYKNNLADRQIGDRRGRNAVEFKLDGPSGSLPTGYDLEALSLDPSKSTLRISASDRRDFYHQVRCSFSRAKRNSIGSFASHRLAGLSGYNHFMSSLALKKSRLSFGDELGGKVRTTRGVPDTLQVGFAGILQGDHAGVEFATDAHTNLLQEAGCLTGSSMLQSSGPWRGSCVLDGLVIDDYFSVSVEDASTPPHLSMSAVLHSKAQGAYERASLLGSPDKDIVAVDFAKIIGAQLDSRTSTRKRGLTLLGSPGQKRYGLSWLSLILSQLRWTSDSLHLCLLGGWSSALLYRRPFFGLVNACFGLVEMSDYDERFPKMLPLNKQTCDELVLLAVLAPLMQTNLAAVYLDEVFCSDASLQRGAVLKAMIPPEVAKVVFRSSKSKGSYSKLNSHVVLDGALDHEEYMAKCEEPSKPIAFKYHFIEVFAGASKISDGLSAFGWVVGPPLDLGESPEYDMKLPHLMRWLSFLISEGRLWSFFASPPCTTFSIMRRPQLRDRENVFGYDPWEPQTQTGNILGQRGFQLLHLGRRYYVPGVLETPNSSKLKNLPSWGHQESKPEACCVRVDSCRYGSIHLKPFKFLGVHVDLRPIALRCICKEKHVKVEGAFTKSSATYTDELAAALAAALHTAILAKKDFHRSQDEIEVAGLESQLSNLVMKSSPWRVHKDWKFKRMRHINLLELAAVEELVKDLAAGRGSSRISNFVDSNVVRCAVSKGRSSSKAISSGLRRIGANVVAGDLYMRFPFSPTRLNVADDPTRAAPLRSPVPSNLLESLSEEEMFKLAALGPLKRWASNWMCLTLGIFGRRALYLNDKSIYPRRVLKPVASFKTSIEFDSTLGFPGEGPYSSAFSLAIYLLLLLGICTLSPLVVLGISSSIPIFRRRSLGFSGAWLAMSCLSIEFRSHFGATAMPMFPRNSADKFRAATRERAGPLLQGRHVTAVTVSMRSSLLAAFEHWTETEGIPWAELLRDGLARIEEINAVIIAYGRQLHRCGRPYQHYAETINAIAGQRLSLKRSLQGAWSLAFSWLQSEPSAHHVAMPVQVLMALLSVCILWGWNHVGGMLALGWGAFLRAGEMLSARRQQLVLPSDVGFSTAFALFSIMEPKTRFSAAKHQCAKLDIPDLLQYVELCLAPLRPEQRIWPFSGQTMRTRLRQLLKAVGLQTERSITGKPLDLGSLRAGGATWALMALEDSELIRRRGRWVNSKTMEIYIQEVSAVQYMGTLESDVRSNVILLAGIFPKLLEKISKLSSFNIPMNAWRFLLTTP